MRQREGYREQRRGDSGRELDLKAVDIGKRWYDLLDEISIAMQICSHV